jgi:hypothetical protein
VIQFVLIRSLLIVAILLTHSLAHASPKAELWALWQKHDAASKQKIDHSAWDRFLKQYVIAPHPSGINRVRYQAVTPEERKNLKAYLQTMQSLPISTYNRAEQKAYWINLYNAVTIDVILSRFPVASIRDINIQPMAYTGENTETLLERAAVEFINHARGVAIQKGRLQVSSIYVWFQEDFGGDPEELMEHWQKYANPALAEALEKYSGGLAHDYDWRLNGAESQP